MSRRVARLAWLAAAGGLAAGAGCLPSYVLDRGSDASSGDGGGRDGGDAGVRFDGAADVQDAQDEGAAPDAFDAPPGADALDAAAAQDAQDVRDAADAPGETVCVASCAGRSCGPDGCGGTCGSGCSGSTVCNIDAGQCATPANCREILGYDPSAPSGAYTITPQSTRGIQVYCDMNTDGGGWTVVSINGSLAADGCVHALASDAAPCGATPDPRADWQLDGVAMMSIQFTDILFYAYDTNPTVPAGATKLHFQFAQNVSSLAPTGTVASWAAAAAATPITCDGRNVSARTAIGRALDGSTVFGEVDTGCSGNTGLGLGLHVTTTDSNGSVLASSYGWDGERLTAGCYCTSTLPGGLAGYRGYFGLR